MTALPMIVDLRLVRLRDGRWRLRMPQGTVTCAAQQMPEEVRALVAALVTPRHHGRTRWDGAEVSP